MAGISSKSLAFGEPGNKLKFNGIEFNGELGLNMLEARFRGLDPQIGRFWQADPRPNEQFSLYASMANNPILFSDPLGDTTWLFGRNGGFVGVIHKDGYDNNQVHFLESDGGSQFVGHDFNALEAKDQAYYAKYFREHSIAFIGDNTVADMKAITNEADKKGYELGFVVEIAESKELRMKQLSDKYRNGDRAYDLIKAIDDNYTEEQQDKIFGVGHVHNKKHVADLSGYDGYTGIMAKFLRLNTPSAGSNGVMSYPDYQPFLSRYDPSTKSYKKGATAAFILSAYGVSVYGTGTGYGGYENVVQNPILPNEYKSYILYKQLKK